MAVTSIGAVAVPLNSWWQGDELEYGLNNSESNYLLLTKSVWNDLEISVLKLKNFSESENPDHSDIDFTMLSKIKIKLLIMKLPSVLMMMHQ